MRQAKTAKPAVPSNTSAASLSGCGLLSISPLLLRDAFGGCTLKIIRLSYDSVAPPENKYGLSLTVRTFVNSSPRQHGPSASKNRCSRRHSEQRTCTMFNPDAAADLSTTRTPPSKVEISERASAHRGSRPTWDKAARFAASDIF